MTSNTPNEGGDAATVGKHDRKRLSKSVVKLLSQLEEYRCQETEDDTSPERTMDENWMSSDSHGTTPNRQNITFPALVTLELHAALNAYFENGSRNTTDRISINDNMEYFVKEGDEYHKLRSTFFKNFLESLNKCSVTEEGNEDGAIKFEENPDLMIQLEEHWLRHEDGIMVDAMAAYYKAHMKEIKHEVGVLSDDNVPDESTLLSQLSEYWLQQNDGKMLSGLANYYKGNMKESEGGPNIVHDDENMPKAGDLSLQLYESLYQNDDTTSMIEALKNYKGKTKNDGTSPSVSHTDNQQKFPIVTHSDGGNELSVKFTLPSDDQEEPSTMHGKKMPLSIDSTNDGEVAMLDFANYKNYPQTPMPSTKNSNGKPLTRRNSMWGGGKEKKEPAKVFHTTWWIIYCVNVLAYVLAVLFAPYSGDDSYGYPGHAAGIPICFLLLATTILITDITTDFFCIGFAIFNPSKERMLIGDVTSCPVTPGRRTQYLVVYCLKSSEPEDIESTLTALQGSWRLNQSYGNNATYLILSGTQDPDLVKCERDGIEKWNDEHVEEEGRVRYIRRCRSILFKYGQYLDLLMLINGHKEPMLFKDQKSKYESGEVFDPYDKETVAHLYGSDYEYIVLCDRDNVLSYNFFHIATNFFAEHPDIEILQPAITPFPEEFRKGENGDTCYSTLCTLFQQLGLGLQRYKRVFIPSAAFYGKGIIRRSVYNRTLLGYDPLTKTTDEKNRIPRDLLSHDIIESSIMKTMMAPELAIYEEFPATHLEWSLRAQRWDLGDLIVSKYLYPFSFGLLPNLLSKFTFHSVTPFYEEFFRNNSAAVYSSTYNLRCVLIKPLVLLTMLAYILADLYVLGLLLLLCFINFEVVLIPLAGKFK